MAKGYSLKKTVRAGKPADEDDIWMLKQALREEGYYAEPVGGMTAEPDANLFDAIRDFQNANGLTEDGIINPGGETERRMAPLLAASPTYWCKICGGPHGGSKSTLICRTCLTRMLGKKL